ncbi:hypothetical protein HDU89_008359 [Geranomyces variabilis]|nr:hypothetical protein HDU89_008359 [Geranomyces variabilis]
MMKPAEVTYSCLLAAQRALRSQPVAHQHYCQQVRAVSVRAMRAAARATEQQPAATTSTRRTDADRRSAAQRKQDPYRPVTASQLVVGSLPMDLQRAAHLLHRAVQDENWTVALANYRVLADRNVAKAVTAEDFTALIRHLGRTILQNGAYMPSDKEIKRLSDLFAHFRRDYRPFEIPDDVYAILIDAYARRENTLGMEEVWNMIFDDGVQPSLELYNSTIQLYSKQAILGPAEKVFRALLERQDIQPDDTTLAALIKARAAGSDVDGALELTNLWLDSGRTPHIKLFNSLLMAYRKAHKVDAIKSVLQHLDKHNILPNIITYNVIIDMYAKAGLIEEALAILKRMKLDSEAEPWRAHCAPDIFTLNSLIEMYVKIDDMKTAVELFESMHTYQTAPEVVTFTTIMNGYRIRADVENVEKYFQLMTREHGIRPTASPYSVLIATYAASGNVARVREVYDEIIKQNIVPNRKVYRSLIWAHEIAGDPKGAAEWYWTMRKRAITPDHQAVATAIRSQVWYAAPADEMFKSVNRIYADAERCSVVQTDVVNQLIHAHLRYGRSVTGVISSVYETEMRGRRLKPNYHTLNTLLSRGVLPSPIAPDPQHNDATRFKELLKRFAAEKAVAEEQSTDSTTPSAADNAAPPSTPPQTKTPLTDPTETAPIPLFPPDVAGSTSSGSSLEPLTRAINQLADEHLGRQPADAKAAEARALLAVYQDIVASGSLIPRATVFRLAGAMDELIGPVEWGRLAEAV